MKHSHPRNPQTAMAVTLLTIATLVLVAAVVSGLFRLSEIGEWGSQLR